MSSLARAIETGDAALLPSRREEDWHWTDLRGLVRALPAPSARIEGALAQGPFGRLDGGSAAAVVNGWARGVDAAFAAPGALIALRIVGQGDGAHLAVLPPLKVAGGEVVTLLESYEGEGAYLTETDLFFEVASGASLERIVLCDQPADAITVSRAAVTVEPGGRFSQTVVTSGARRQRLETRVRHQGGDARVRLDGLYILDARTHADITTVVDHVAPGGSTDQLTKGVVRGQARGVFQGRIVVREGADRTDARLGHHALVLSDRAEVDAKPELEIFADDVACAHGNTVGALDPDALFYAQSRGIPEPRARALLTEAFLAEVVARIGHGGARAAVGAWLAGRLGAPE